jgi:hypothetical protein
MRRLALVLTVSACAEPLPIESVFHAGPKGKKPPRVDAAPPEIAAVAADGQIAIFTAGAYTVRFHGPQRTFTESKFGITNVVETDAWVRLLSAPFDGAVDAGWLDDAAADNAAGVPDLLATATEYFEGMLPLLDADGLQIAGDAGYGDDIGADWNDYIGLTWTYPDGAVDSPESADFRNLDCSGYVRMLFGWRGGIPMSIGTPVDNRTLPRTSDQMSRWSPGVVVIPRAGDTQVTDLSPLRAGDLVFFDTGSSPDGVIDHVGIFLGVDTAGRHRMLNSRSSMDGPTLRDGAGSAYGESATPSVIDGNTYYARALRTARRL